MVEKKSKIEGIIKEIGSLSVLELNELVKALEEKFGVSAATMTAPTAAAAGAQPEAETKEEKAEYDIILAAAGNQKIKVIKAVREINQQLGLKEAKELVESAPKPVLQKAKKEDAEAAKKKLEEVGAKVELK